MAGILKIVRGSSSQFQLLSRRHVIPHSNPVSLHRLFGPPTISFAKAPLSTGSGTQKPDASENNTVDKIPPNGEPGTSADSLGTRNGNGNGLGIDIAGSAWNGNDIGKPQTDWSKSYHGLSSHAFTKDVADILLAPVDPLDIEVKPGGFF